MAGMIARRLAARHPQAVRSLTSIMSSTGSLRSGQPALRTYSVFLRRAPLEREAFIAHMERVFAAIGSRGLPRDYDDIPAIPPTGHDRDHGSEGAGRQLPASIAPGDPRGDPRRINAPTL